MNLLITQIDGILTALTNDAIHLLNPADSIELTANLYLAIASSLVQVVMNRYPKLLDHRGACRYLLPNPSYLSGRRSRWHVAGSLHYALSYPSKSGRPWDGGNDRPPSPPGWHAGGRFSSYWPPGTPSPRGLRRSACNGPWSGSGASAFWPSAWMGLRTLPAAV